MPADGEGRLIGHYAKRHRGRSCQRIHYPVEWIARAADADHEVDRDGRELDAQADVEANVGQLAKTQRHVADGECSLTASLPFESAMPRLAPAPRAEIAPEPAGEEILDSR